MSTATQPETDQGADPILDAIDQRLAAANELVGRLTVLRRLVEQAIELNVGQLHFGVLDLSANGHETSSSAGSEEPAPPKPEGGGLSKVKQAVRREGAADRVDRTGRGDKGRQDVIDLVRRKPGLNGTEIAKELGIDNSTGNHRLNQLARAGSVRREKDGNAKRYYPPEHEMVPTDPTGCKTEVERKLFAAIKDAPIALTANKAAAAAGVNSQSTAGILAALARRGVLRQLNGGGSPRWEVTQ